MSPKTYKILAVIYAVCTGLVTFYVWGAHGAIAAWIFCAFACGLPQVISKSGYF